MDPEQVVRDDQGVMRCRECGFAYNHTPSEVAEQTRMGLEAVTDSVRETPAELRDRRREPGVWSINAYVWHLGEAAGIITSRLASIAEEDRPAIPYYEEAEAVEEARADTIPADSSLQTLKGRVTKFLSYLEALQPAAWHRLGTHARAGEVALSDIAHDMPHELTHHARDIQVIHADLTR